ncbi:unnamed protein product [Linum trigynum]|uniref:F-box domain-containing protein n=1 Tax=Linum trigynum TaxID=586398 RepID=A0AAV2DPN0_9ROSI
MAAAKDTNSPDGGGGGGWPLLPEELLTKVLNRLPLTRCLFQFRCVSKSWHRLLSDIPNFISRRILFNEDDENAPIMVARIADKDKASVRYTALCPDTLRPVSTYSGASFSSPTIAGCRNGIFCIHDSPGFPCPTETLIALWNPTTSESKFAPSLPTPPRSNCATVGFGFDPQATDYKVLVIFTDSTREENRGGSITAWVYSLRKNSWTQVETHGINRPIYGLCSGFHHWHSSSSRSEKIYIWQDNIGGEAFKPADYYATVVSFDLSKQVFETVYLRLPRPTYVTGSGHYIVRSMSVVEECLIVVLSISKRLEEKVDYEVWMVLEPWLELEPGCHHWVKLLVVSVDRFSCLGIAGFWKHGKCFVVDSDGRLCLLDMETGCIIDQLEVEGKGFIKQEVMTYVPSMVSLSS